MRHGNTRSLGRSDRGGDPGNNFDGNPGMSQHEHLFGTATEYERIATLQSHDTFALPRRTDHETVDRVLLDAGSTSALADTKTLRPRQAAERFGIDQRVVQNEVGLFNAPQRTKGPQLRITGSGTNQRDSAY
jgi:predicted DNA-binding protein (UPF0251 family)